MPERPIRRKSDEIRRKPAARASHAAAKKPVEAPVEEVLPREKASAFLKKMERERAEEAGNAGEYVPDDFHDSEHASRLTSSVKKEEYAESSFDSARTPSGMQFRFFRKSAVIAVFSVLMITVAGMFILSTVFARLTITIKPQTDTRVLSEINAVFDAEASEAVPNQNLIPAEFLEFSKEVSQEFQSSGEEFVQSQSRGLVHVYNNISPVAQTLVARTRFVTDKGVVFRTPKAVTVPAMKMENGKLSPQFVEVELVADKTGEGGNISGEQRLKIPGFQGTPKYEGFYAVAPNGFIGGSQGRSRVITKEDATKAQEQLSKRVFDELKTDVVRKIPPQFKLVDGLYVIEITSLYVPPEKTAVVKFTGTAKAAARVFVFRDADVLSILQNAVLHEDNMHELIADFSGLKYRLKTVMFEKKRAEVAIGGSVRLKSVVNKDELAENAKGKKEGSIIDLLRVRKEFASFSIVFFPPWLFTAPANPKKITVIVQEPIIASPSPAALKK